MVQRGIHHRGRLRQHQGILGDAREALGGGRRCLHGLGRRKLEHFEDCYLGEYNSEEDYARQYIADCYDLDRLMGSLSNYFDYEAFARELFMYDMYYDNGHVFRHW